jgi:hypothetical protein
MRICLKTGMINTGLVLFSLIVLTSMPTFGYAKNVYQPENRRVSSGVVGTTEQAQVQLISHAALSGSLDSAGDQSLLTTEVLRESLRLLAQKDSKSESKQPKAEGGKTGDKRSEASKKDDNDNEDEEEEEEDDEDDDEEKGKPPATKEEKKPQKGGS